MQTRTQLDTVDGPMALYDVQPTSPPNGAVIVIQEAFGVNEHIEDVTRRFATHGYRAIAPHMFHRTGDPTFDYSELEEALTHVDAMTEAGVVTDLAASVSFLSAQSIAENRVAVVGFCAGGSVAFLAAVHFTLGAAVTFYGGGIASGRFGSAPHPELAPSLKTPWLGLYGDQDHRIPPTEVESLRRALSAASVPTEIHRYSEAGHGFHCDARSAYHEPSARDAWKRSIDWLDTYIGAPTTKGYP